MEVSDYTRKLTTERVAISTPNAPGHLKFMSQAIKVGNLLFTGGSVPRDAKTLEIPVKFEDQAELVFKNLKIVAEAGGTSLANAVKVTVFLSDIRNWEKMNTSYNKYFTGSPPPARSTVQVAALNSQYQIEVEAVILIP